MKSLEPEKQIPKNRRNLQLSCFLDEEGLFHAKGRIVKSQLDLKAKHPDLLHWIHYLVEFYFAKPAQGQSTRGQSSF